MDITLGIFKDSPNKAETQKMLSKTSDTSVGGRPKSSFTSSLELLTPVLVNKTRPRSVEGATSSKKSPEVCKSNIRSQTAESKKADEEKEKMRRAIIKMKKLDKILAEKTLQEKQIKLQRLQNEWNLHTEMAQFKIQNGESNPQTDVVNNAAKYLALLPPLQQLEVLIERCESTDDFSESFFQTEFPDECSDVKSNPEQRSKSSTSYRKHEDKKKNHTTHKKESVPDENSEERGRDFIKRNIELVKDAGQLIMMTSDEKHRLSELLEDLDTENDQPTETDESAGYQPENGDMNRLSEIDERLLSISADMSSLFGGSEVGSMLNYKGFDPILPTAVKSNLTEVFNSSKRFEEIEDRLNRLDTEWKEKFDNQEPRLDEVTLNELLSQYTPQMMMSSRTSSDSHHSSQLVEVLAPSGGNSSSTFGDVTVADDAATSVYSSVSLSRLQLDELLEDARTCLGLPQPSSRVDCCIEEEVVVNVGDLRIQSLDVEAAAHIFAESSSGLAIQSPIDR